MGFLVVHGAERSANAATAEILRPISFTIYGLLNAKKTGFAQKNTGLRHPATA
jgi:hypothetical protein